MIRSSECIPKCMQAELVGTPEYSCAVACEIAMVRERERTLSLHERGRAIHQEEEV